VERNLVKTERITVNKTPDRPDGVQIELVQPKTDLEANVLMYLLPAKLREAKQTGRLNFVLPDRFEIQHKKDGTFVVSGVLETTEYYQPPRPLAIVELHRIGATCDIVHAPIDLDKLRKQQQQAAKQTKKAAGQGDNQGEEQPADEGGEQAAATDTPDTAEQDKDRS